MLFSDERVDCVVLRVESGTDVGREVGTLMVEFDFVHPPLQLFEINSDHQLSVYSLPLSELGGAEEMTGLVVLELDSVETSG